MANDIGGPISGRNDGPGSFFAGVPRTAQTGGVPVKASTDGTDTTPVITETYIAELEVAVGCRATGFANFNGSVASGNLKVILYNSAGKVIASSASTASLARTHSSASRLPRRSTCAPGVTSLACRWITSPPA